MADPLPKRKRERRSKRGEKKAPSNQDNKQVNKRNTNVKKERKNIFIPQKMVGFLIGFRGCSIQSLKERTHCIINIPDTNENDINNFDDKNSNSNSNKDESDNKTDNDKDKNSDKDKFASERTEIELVGSIEEIALCQKEIEFMVNNGRFMLDSERGIITSEEEKEIAVDMKIPAKVCGMLIGGKGAKIHEIMLITGCEIWVERQDNVHVEAGVSTVHLKGRPKNVAHAQKEIRRVLTLWGGAGGKDASRLVFELPSYCGRTIIGEKGNTIREIQTQFHVSIRITNFKSNDYRYNPRMNRDIQNTCVVSITGEQEDRIDAKRIIDELVGIFVKCQQCKKFVEDDEGYSDDYLKIWYCNDCWKEYYGEKPKDDKNDDKKNQSQNQSQNRNYNQNQNINTNQNRGNQSQSQSQNQSRNYNQNQNRNYNQNQNINANQNRNYNQNINVSRPMNIPKPENQRPFRPQAPRHPPRHSPRQIPSQYDHEQSPPQAAYTQSNKPKTSQYQLTQIDKQQHYQKPIQRPIQRPMQRPPMQRPIQQPNQQPNQQPIQRPKQQQFVQYSKQGYQSKPYNQPVQYEQQAPRGPPKRHGYGDGQEPNQGRKPPMRHNRRDGPNRPPMKGYSKW